MSKKIENKIIKFNTKLNTLIDKFAQNVTKLSMSNRELFPNFTDDDFKEEEENLASWLKQCMIMNEDSLDDVTKRIEDSLNTVETD